VDSTKTAGQSLVEDLTGEADPYAITVMIVEAGRIADRLQKLDALITGRQTLWATLCFGRDDVVEVRVDNALPEARQQATVLRQLLAEIQRQRGQSRSAPSDDDLAGL
jgi:hypothetical protein